MLVAIALIVVILWTLGLFLLPAIGGILYIIPILVLVILVIFLDNGKRIRG